MSAPSICSVLSRQPLQRVSPSQPLTTFIYSPSLPYPYPIHSLTTIVSTMSWYQQFRTWAFALSLAMWHVITQGFRNIFCAFKPDAEELPIAISGSTFTPTHESIAMDAEICGSLPPSSFKIVVSLLCFLQLSHVVYISPRVHRAWRDSPCLRCDHVDRIPPSVSPFVLAVLTLTQCFHTG